MIFVDFHTHIYPEKIALKATDYLMSTFEAHAEWPATAENLLIFGKAAGISNFVVLPVAQKVEQVRKINDFAIGVNNENPEFFGFGTLHAGMENLVEEVDYIKKSGLYGIKLHPDQQNYEMDCKELDCAFDYLSELQLPVLFHCGDPVSNLSHPARLKNILHKFPKLKVVAAHFGGWQCFDAAMENLKDENCFFDMSSSMYYLGLKKTAEFIKAYGAERIFFGSDFPLWGQDLEIEKFMQLDIPDSNKEKIAGLNALEFLKK